MTIDDFIEYLAKARVLEDREVDIIARAINKVFTEEK
jgi:hypothetical protein